MFGEIAITGRLPVTIPGIANYSDGIQIGATRAPLPTAFVPARNSKQKGS
jgi:hypothetical protein